MIEYSVWVYFFLSQYFLLYSILYLQDEDSEMEESDADQKSFKSHKGNDTRQGMSFEAFQTALGGEMANDKFVLLMKASRDS